LEHEERLKGAERAYGITPRGEGITPKVDVRGPPEGGPHM